MEKEFVLVDGESTANCNGGDYPRAFVVVQPGGKVFPARVCGCERGCSNTLDLREFPPEDVHYVSRGEINTIEDRWIDLQRADSALLGAVYDCLQEEADDTPSVGEGEPEPF